MPDDDRDQVDLNNYATQFRRERRKRRRLAKAAQATNLSTHNIDLISEMPAETSVMFPAESYQPALTEVVEVEDANPDRTHDLGQIHRKTFPPVVRNRVGYYEEMAWYHLFPHGVNGLNQSRQVSMTTFEYFRQRIMGKDTRFQINDYLLFALNEMEASRVTSTINVVGS